MKKLLEGIVDFRKRVLPTRREKFAELAKGQNPDVLFITCSDSRVAPNWFASTDPGDLFVVRNVGNLVPPAACTEHNPDVDKSALAAVEFSILRLNVSHIVVCGHSECGAMNAILAESPLEDSPHLKSWLSYGADALQKLKKGFAINPSLSKVNELSQLNVLQQIEHLKSHALIRKRVDDGTLQIHAWWFDIAKADVYYFEKSTAQFKLIE